MRPLRLRLGGFTCFRDEQDIDFAGLELFAIAGPTGAGKTSLLDAMVFALYGEVPRMGAQGLSELISLGRDRAFAMLDFAIATDHYRIARRIRRQGPTVTQLERLADAGPQPVAEGVRDVDQHVQRLLGIDASTFLKAVILPQGRFADFLKSKPAVRRAMLRSLLQLEIYERMRARADQIARGAEHEATALRRRISDDFADATPARLAAVDHRLGELVIELAAAAAAADRARSSLEILERTDRLRRELAALRTRYAELQRSRPAIEDGERRIAASERALPLIAILDAVAEAEVRHASARHALTTLAPLAELALDRHRAAADELARAQASAAEQADLAIKLARLDEAAPLLARRAECERLATQAGAQHAAADRDLAAAITDRARAEELAARCRSELTELAQQLSHLDHDPGQLGRLAAALGPAADVSARCRDLARAVTTQSTLDDACAKAVAELTRAHQAMQDAAAAEAAADARHARAVTALEASRRAHVAHDLRSTLVPGAPCPVCQQPIAVAPPADAPLDLAAATRDERAADRDRQRGTSTAQDARVALELAEQAHATAVRARDRHPADLAGIARDRDASARRLFDLVGDLAGDLASDPARVPDPMTLAAAVPTLHADAHTRADERVQNEHQRTELATRLATLTSGAELAAQRAHSARSECERAARDAAAADCERAARDARIQLVSP